MGFENGPPLLGNEGANGTYGVGVEVRLRNGVNVGVMLDVSLSISFSKSNGPFIHCKRGGSNRLWWGLSHVLFTLFSLHATWPPSQVKL